MVLYSVKISNSFQATNALQNIVAAAAPLDLFLDKHSQIQLKNVLGAFIGLLNSNNVVTLANVCCENDIRNWFLSIVLPI